MKVFNATWEKRNLGLEALEIEIEKSDKTDVLRTVLKESHNFQYVVVKLPVGNLAILHELERNGFFFLETQFEIFRKLKEIVTYPKYVNNLLHDVKLKKISGKANISDLIERLDEKIFSSDRISLDPEFSVKVGNKRYQKWIRDEVYRKGSEIFEFEHLEKSIGFIMVNDDGSNKLRGLLGGIYSEYHEGGYGICLIEKPFDLCLMKKKNLYWTRISSNNVAVLKLYFRMNYHVRDVIYVLRKIKKG